MSVQHKATSIKNKPKSVEELTRENEQLREKNESLSGQVTDLPTCPLRRLRNDRSDRVRRGVKEGRAWNGSMPI